MGAQPALAGHKAGAAVRGPKDGSRAASTGHGNHSSGKTDRPNHAPELDLSPMSRKVRHFDKYSRKGGRWSWKRPSYERGVVSLVKTERRIEEGIASALTEVEAVEAGLRYFDELIMPPNKRNFTYPTTVDGELRRPPSLPAPPTGQFPQHRQQNPEAAPPEQFTKGRKGASLRSKGRQEGGGFSRSPEKSVRDYQAAKKTGVGRGSRITSRSDRAVSECVDLKLTLKQRLDNYDRQRGINLSSLHEDGTPPVPVIQGRQRDHDVPGTNQTRSTNLGASGSRAATMPAGSGEGQGSSAVAPCCDGGILDDGSVGKILARSLGNAATELRLNRPGGGGNASKKIWADGDDSSNGIAQAQDSFAVRSRWRSWNEAPPEALLTVEDTRRVSAGRREDDRRRQRPPPDVIAEIVPPLQSRRRLKKLSESSTPGSSGAAVAKKATPNSDLTRSKGGKEGEPLSTASSASSRRSSAGGVSLVPRVAMLAAASTAEKSHTEAARKGKDFDPDQLECVRRHEASVAEKERRVRSLRTEEEKRTHFRARPLPVFLESGGVSGPGSRASGGGGGAGQSIRDRGPVISATGVAGTSPELLAALEQDEEARALAEKIRNINPRADIVSIVLQSTPRTTFVPPQTSWNSDGGIRTVRRSSSRGATPTASTKSNAPPPSSFAKHPTTRQHFRGDGSPLPSSTPLSEADGLAAATVAVGSGGPEATIPARIHMRDASSTDSDVKIPRFPGTQEPRAVGTGSGSSHARSENYSYGGESPQPSNGRAFESATPPAANLAGSGGVEGADGRGLPESTGRSLMGRMLGSGMLERQREWAKARNRKVLESRRKVEEAKEREGKGDILDAGSSGRSWSKAKMEHQRSLQRQREEEEAREQIQEARRRASEARAERERRSAEQRAAELAQTLATAADEKGVGLEGGRESRTAPNSRGGGGRRRSRRPPRRARSDAGDGRVVDSSHRGGIDESAAENGNAESPDAAEGDNIISEESFYRVAVEKIMEKERLGAAISDRHGDDVGASGAGGKTGGIRSSGRRRPHGEARNDVTAQIVFASPRSAGAGRSGRRKTLVARRNRRRASGVTRAPVGQAAERRRPSEGRGTTGQDRSPFERSRAQSPALSKGVTRTRSLLSLYEAQSVEHVAGGGGDPGGRDNSGPFFDFDGNIQFGLGASATGPSFYGLGRRGQLVEHRTPAGRDRLQDREAGERSASLAETGESGDFPWSDERRASWSRGSGGAAARCPGRSNIDSDAPANDAGVDTRWDDVLRSGGRDGLRAISIRNGDSLTEGIDVSDGYRDGEPEAAIAGSGGLPHLPTDYTDRGHHPEVFPQPSPRNLSSTQRRRERITSPTTTLSPQWSVPANQPHLDGDGHSVNEEEARGADGFGGAGVGFSLWSSSDEDASVTKVFGGDEHGDENGDDENGGPRYGVQAGGPNSPSSGSIAATSAHRVSGGAVSSVTASAGPFFDAATSSADKGRYKVRDPRLFDPCSMHRRPDVTAVALALTPPPGAGIGDGGGCGTDTTRYLSDRASSSTGVTLLLGRRLENADGGIRNGEKPSEGAEQVITVMFDRSKFNEQEARRWWTANRTRIESIGSPRT